MAFIDINIDELNRIIEYNWEIFSNTSKKDYSKMTAAKIILGVAAEKRKKRAIQLENLRDEIWPK